MAFQRGQTAESHYYDINAISGRRSLLQSLVER